MLCQFLLYSQVTCIYIFFFHIVIVTFIFFLIMDLQNRLVVAKGEGVGMGWIGSLGLIDANCYLWNGLAMRCCCVALGTMFSHL